jgi:hypothetical protein
MILRNVLNIRWLVVLGFMVMAIIAFNLSNPTLKNNLVTSFNEWYEGTSQQFQPNADPKTADLSLRISVTLSYPALGVTPSTWALPARSLICVYGAGSRSASILGLLRLVAPALGLFLILCSAAQRARRTLLSRLCSTTHALGTFRPSQWHSTIQWPWRLPNPSYQLLWAQSPQR